MNRGHLAALLCVASFSAAAAPASASNTLVVDDDHAQCPTAAYTTIQSAVDAAAPGDRILVCRGTYPEQVTIPAGKDRISLLSKELWKAVIQAPPVMAPPFAIVRVNGAKDVGITAFTIQGPATIPGTVQVGVQVDGGGSAGIFLNHVTHIRDNPLNGNQYGVGILVGRRTQATTGSAVISGNVVDDYQKGGIVIDNAGSKGTVTFNAVKGVGPTGAIAQNGIQVSGGADANINHNSVSNNIFTVQTFESSGILASQPGKAKIEENASHHNDGGVVAQFSDANTTIEENASYSNTFEGVELTAVQGSIARENATFKNGDSGVGLFFGTMGAQVLYNRSTDNANDGLFADSDTSGNTFKSNVALRNANFDCEDASPGPANTWINNIGVTASPPTICKKDGTHSGDGDRSATRIPKVSAFR
jgi:hypothetical protein